MLSLLITLSLHQMPFSPLLQQPHFSLQVPDFAILLIFNLLCLQRQPGPLQDLIGQEGEGEAFEEGAAMSLVVGSVGTGLVRVEL